MMFAGYTDLNLNKGLQASPISLTHIFKEAGHHTGTVPNKEDDNPYSQQLDHTQAISFKL